MRLAGGVLGLAEEGWDAAGWQERAGTNLPVVGGQRLAVGGIGWR